MTCELCGSVRKIHQHHPDYSKPDETIPLCSSCHRDVHNGVIAEPRTGRFYVRGEAYKAAGRSSTTVTIDPKLLPHVKRTAKIGQRSLVQWVNRAIEYALDVDDKTIQAELNARRSARAKMAAQEAA